MLAVGLITTLLLNIKNLEFFRLFPFLGSGVENIAIHSLRFSDTFYPIIAVILFGPFLGSGKLSGKVAYKALGWGVLMLTVTILCMSMTLSDNSYTQVLSPLYYIMSLIDFGRFFDMVDPLFLFGWLTGIAVSGGFLICAISTLITRFFHTKHYRITCFIVTAAAIVMSLLLDEQIFIPYSFFKDYAWALLYAPFVLLFIANIRRKPIENR